MLLKFNYSIGEDGTLVFWNLKTGARAEPEAAVFFFFFFQVKGIDNIPFSQHRTIDWQSAN